jgi:hypothetical protein
MKGYLKDAAMILAVYAVVAVIQKQMMIPVIGEFLPGGRA